MSEPLTPEERASVNEYFWSQFDRPTRWAIKDRMFYCFLAGFMLGGVVGICALAYFEKHPHS